MEEQVDGVEVVVVVGAMVKQVEDRERRQTHSPAHTMISCAKGGVVLSRREGPALVSWPCCWGGCGGSRSEVRELLLRCWRAQQVE